MSNHISMSDKYSRACKLVRAVDSYDGDPWKVPTNRQIGLLRQYGIKNRHVSRYCYVSIENCTHTVIGAIFRDKYKSALKIKCSVEYQATQCTSEEKQELSLEKIVLGKQLSLPFGKIPVKEENNDKWQQGIYHIRRIQEKLAKLEE